MLHSYCFTSCWLLNCFEHFSKCSGSIQYDVLQKKSVQINGQISRNISKYRLYLSTYLHLGHRNSSDYGTYSKMCTQVHKMTTSCCIPLYFACQLYFEKSLGNWKKKWKMAWYSFLLSWILISSFRPNGNNNSTIMFCITYLSRIGKSKLQHLEPRFVS